jgi:predicted alpha/beta superfamily hydrolase
LFGTVVDTIRMMHIPALLPAVLVVGIGYPGAATIVDTLAIRARDLTPTPMNLFPGSGGAPSFLQFIRGELSPWIGQRWPDSLRRRIYFGHSLGGLFGVHALFAESPVFDDYVISSPSLWWDHHAPYDWEKHWAAGHDDLTAQTYFSIGADETDEGRRLEATNLPEASPFKPPPTYLDMVGDLWRFTSALRRRRYPNLTVAMDVFPHEFHATAAPIALNRGLRHLLGRA